MTTAEQRLLLVDIGQQLSEAVYLASARWFEQAEHEPLIRGNGHHLAQALAKHAADMLMERETAGEDTTRSQSEYRQENPPRI